MEITLDEFMEELWRRKKIAKITVLGRVASIKSISLSYLLKQFAI